MQANFFHFVAHGKELAALAGIVSGLRSAGFAQTLPMKRAPMDGKMV